MASLLTNPKDDRKKGALSVASSRPKSPPATWASPITNPYGKASRSLEQKYGGQAIGPSTPQAEIDRRASHTRWNAGLTNDGFTSTWSDTPGGMATPRVADLVGDLIKPKGFTTQKGAGVSAPQKPQPALTNPATREVSTERAPSSAVAATPAVANGITRFGGAMVNGVPTFSDGSAGVPRTVSADQLKAAEGALTIVPDSAFARPLASDALGHTPSSEEMVQRRMAGQWAGVGSQPTQLVNPMQQARADQTWEQMGRQSDMAAVANGDWRSPIGTAASNLRLDMRTGSTRERKAAAAALADLQQSVAQSHNTAAAQLGAIGRTGMTQAGQTQRTGMAQAGANQRAVLNQPGGQFTTLGNGTLALANPKTGQVQLARGPDGQPVLMPSTAKARPDDTAYQKYRDAMVTQLLHLDPNGQIADPNVEGGFRQPNMADYAAAQKKAKALADMNYGRKVSQPMWTLLAKARNPDATPEQLAAEYTKYAKQFQR